MQFLIFAQQTQRINIGKGELIGGSDKFILQFFKQVREGSCPWFQVVREVRGVAA